MNKKKGYERKEFYKCYSFPLRDFISAHNIYYMSTGVHPRTDKVFYVYEMTEELSKVLTAWSDTNPNK